MHNHKEFDHGRALGKQGYYDGLQAPAQDPEIIKMIKGRQPRESTDLLMGWVTGHTEEQLKAPVWDHNKKRPNRFNS
ncbi:MAG: hypothetical protein HC843_04640 [Sphingomonadales bacterium]|nr:hypothetical protein [Sphingomonadales bacterium]